jgi:hypothetical protein
LSQHGHGACRFWAADISRIGDLSAGIQQHELDVLPFITFRDLQYPVFSHRDTSAGAAVT